MSVPTSNAMIIILPDTELGWAVRIYDDSRAPGERLVGPKIAYTTEPAAIEYAAMFGYEATSGKYAVDDIGTYVAIDLVAVAS